MNHWELPSGRLLRNGPHSQTVQTGNWNERQRQTKPCCSSFEACGFHPDDSNEFLVMDADYARHGASRRAPTQNYMYSIQSQRISQNARGYCSEVQNARWMQVPFNASGSMQWWHDMTCLSTTLHDVTFASLHRSLDCLIAWGRKAFVSGRTSERWRWTSGKVDKRQFLLVCARNISVRKHMCNWIQGLQILAQESAVEHLIYSYLG